MRITGYFFLAICSVFFASCANQVAPQGGEKDTKPPKITKSVPANFSTGYNTNKIAITFDEYIQLKDLNSQLVVSPPLSKTPEAKIKQKTLLIQMEDTLRPNTTYTMNFGNAIVDNNEGNALEDFQYVFSTGDVIDSLFVSGKTENAFDKKSEKGILVMLYRNQEDSVPFKTRPDYFAKTNAKGEFRITNIAPGAYRIFALKESNADYLFNAPDEHVAFSETSVEANSTGNNLEMFQEKPKLHLVKSFSEEPGKAVFMFSGPAPDLHYRFVSDSVKCNLAAVEESKKRDTIIFWYRNQNLDSLILYFTDNASIHDTVAVRLFKEEGKTFLKRKKVLYITTNYKAGEFFDLNRDLVLRFSHPVSTADFSKISLKEDSAELRDLKMTFSDSLKSSLVISHKWKEKTMYHLYVAPSAFSDIFGYRNDTTLSDFKTHQLSDYGTLALKISGSTNGALQIVQLINENEKIFRSSGFTSDTTLNYNFLGPGAYRLKVIEDRNGNGEWDTGNYLLKIQPERVAYYPEPVTIRSNWDVDVKWKPDFSK